MYCWTFKNRRHAPGPYASGEAGRWKACKGTWTARPRFITKASPWELAESLTNRVQLLYNRGVARGSSQGVCKLGPRAASKPRYYISKRSVETTYGWAECYASPTASSKQCTGEFIRGFFWGTLRLPGVSANSARGTPRIGSGYSGRHSRRFSDNTLVPGNLGIFWG